MSVRFNPEWPSPSIDINTANILAVLIVHPTNVGHRPGDARRVAVERDVGDVIDGTELQMMDAEQITALIADSIKHARGGSYRRCVMLTDEKDRDAFDDLTKAALAHRNARNAELDRQSVAVSNDTTALASKISEQMVALSNVIAGVQKQQDELMKQQARRPVDGPPPKGAPGK